jgi:hypothetical protein
MASESGQSVVTWPPSWVARALASWDIDALVSQMHANAMARVFDELRANDEFVELTRGSITENVFAMREHIAGSTALGTLRLNIPVQLARRQAQLFTSQNSLQRSYRLGNQTLMRHWTAHLRRFATEQAIADSDLVVALVTSTERILEYHDNALGIVADEYAEQEAALRRTGRQMRQQIVRDLLAPGAEMVVPRDLLPLLGYDLGLIHVGIGCPGKSPDDVERYLPELMAAADTRQALCVSVTAAEAVVWLGRANAWSADQVGAVAKVLAARDIAASVSRACIGQRGMRESYREILQLAALREFTGDARAIYNFVEVELEALLVKDPAESRRFLEHELGPLSEESATMAELRETVLASFRFGAHTATAAHLFVHEHTVRNRLHKAEQLLDRRLSDRPVELQAALRLRRLMVR